MRRYFYYLRASEARLETVRSASVKAYDCQLFTRDAGVLCFTVTEYDVDTAAQVALVIPDDAELTFGIKPSTARQGEFLALSENDQWNIESDWTDANRATGKICVRVNCNTVEMLALFDTSTMYQDLVAEIQLLEAGATEATTLVQFPVRVTQDIIQGDESSPASANVTTNFRLGSANQLQLLNVTTGLYHSVWLEGADGAPSLVIAEDGEE